MTTSTLRNWGGAVAVSLPKKVLALLDLQAGKKVDIAVENGKVVLTPSKPSHTLEQLLKEQMQLERKMGKRISDQDFLSDAPAGREIL